MGNGEKFVEEAKSAPHRSHDLSERNLTTKEEKDAESLFFSIRDDSAELENIKLLSCTL
jgi:hypothetical protein